MPIYDLSVLALWADTYEWLSKAGRVPPRHRRPVPWGERTASDGGLLLADNNPALEAPR
jgi:hypothetical protein